MILNILSRENYETLFITFVGVLLAMGFTAALNIFLEIQKSRFASQAKFFDKKLNVLSDYCAFLNLTYSFNAELEVHFKNILEKNYKDKEAFEKSNAHVLNLANRVTEERNKILTPYPMFLIDIIESDTEIDNMVSNWTEAKKLIILSLSEEKKEEHWSQIASIVEVAKRQRKMTQVRLQKIYDHMSAYDELKAKKGVFSRIINVFS